VYLLAWPLIMMVARPPMLTETVQLRSFEVPVAGLHPSLHGLKIAHISDLHFNDNNSVEMGTSDDILEQAARIIEREQVDLVVLTGDYVDHWPEAAPALGARWLPRFKGRHGAVAILGNHDYQKPQSKRLVLDAFSKANITVLVNERAEPINEWIEVLGVGDFWEDYHPHRVMYPLPPLQPDTAAENESETGQGAYRKARLVLTHNPDSAPFLSRWGADLMLAGHAHGGQSCLPPGLRQLWPLVSYLPFNLRRLIPGALALNNWDLSYGWIDLPRSALVQGDEADLQPLGPTTIPLYVTSGLDRMPPRFLLCHPEVAIFTLLPRTDKA
jgi:predicted MPP superfamily phosphohydrolase